MRFFVNLTCELSRKLRKNLKNFLFLVVFLFEKWTKNFQYFRIVCADFPSLDRPCLYDLSYGRCVDPNTSSFSAAYRGFPSMPPLVRHAWFGAYSLKQKRPRGARSCILAHFQRVQLFLYETLSKLLLARSRLYEQLRRRLKSRFSQNNVLYTIHNQKRARFARKTIFPPTRKPGPRAQHTKNTLIVLILLFVKKESSSQSSLHTFFLPRDSFTPTMEVFFLMPPLPTDGLNRT